jgi:hypothetical protein
MIQDTRDVPRTYPHRAIDAHDPTILKCLSVGRDAVVLRFLTCMGDMVVKGPALGIEESHEVS